MSKSNGPFLLPQQPHPNDTRERTAFGFLKRFGEAYKAYYDRKNKVGNKYD